MNTITVTFPIDDLGEVLEFVAKAYNDHNYSAQDYKTEYDELITCEDSSDDEDDVERALKYYNQHLKNAELYRTELESLLEYTEREHSWVISNLQRDREFHENIAWLNPNIKRYKDLEFNESDVATIYFNRGNSMIVKRNKERGYGFYNHDIKFIDKNGENYYVEEFKFNNLHHDEWKGIYSGAYNNQVESYMVRVQINDILFSRDDE